MCVNWTLGFRMVPIMESTWTTYCSAVSLRLINHSTWCVMQNRSDENLITRGISVARTKDCSWNGIILRYL